MRHFNPWPRLEITQTVLLGVSSLGLVGSLVPAFFAIIAPDEFVWLLWLWWLGLPFLIIALIVGSAMMSRESKPMAALLIVALAAIPGFAVACFFVAIALQ